MFKFAFWLTQILWFLKVVMGKNMRELMLTLDYGKAGPNQRHQQGKGKPGGSGGGTNR